MKKTKKRIPKVGEVEAVNEGKKISYRRDKMESMEVSDKTSMVTKKQSTPKSIDTRKYHGSVPWDYLTNKQKRLETRKLTSGAVTSRGNEKRAETLKTPTAIAKARKLKDTRKILQNPKKRSEFHKASKEAYAKKQQTKIQQRSAPSKGQKKRGVRK